MDVAPALLLATLVWQVIDWVRELMNLPSQRSAVLTQLAAWVGGVIVVVLAAHSMLFDHFTFNGLTLTQLDGAGQVYLGLVIASFGSSLVDVKQAIDARDSAAKPALLPGAPVAPAGAAPAAAVPPPHG